MSIKTKPRCIVPGCKNANIVAHGRCARCDRRWRRHGDASFSQREVQARRAARLEALTPTCPDDALRRVREELELTQAALAELLGVHRVTTISRWERAEIAVRQPKVLCLALEALRRGERNVGPATAQFATLDGGGLTVSQLATLLGVAPSTLRRWQNDNGSIWHPRMVALALTEIRHLLGGKDGQSSQAHESTARPYRRRR